MTTIVRKGLFILVAIVTTIATATTAKSGELPAIIAASKTAADVISQDVMPNILTATNVNFGKGEYADVTQRTFRGDEVVETMFDRQGKSFTEAKFLYGARVEHSQRSVIAMLFRTGPRPIYKDVLAGTRRVQYIQAREGVGQLRNLTTGGDYPVLDTALSMRDLHLGLEGYRWSEVAVIGSEILLTGENGLYEWVQVRLGLQHDVLVPLTMEVKNRGIHKMHLFQEYRVLTTDKVRPLIVTLVDFERKLRSVSFLTWINIFPSEEAAQAQFAQVEPLAAILEQ
ncbi:hypothetical protein A3H10_04780 [Candidatus Uhrbacteria bacterium RIFCSPLOWO2_12_FULL_46_10]|uniref:Outer membrane lipoprotein-sorting protein n=1 Tax=Candidatus Uhrbacteria bacterium RIFCSPLOWO2_01_FULL_47_25 TaxID=1802402 RepID=A0A1F7UXI8_9BACT|nr:MAG: hypothetical protein A2752_00885 [Candidatus Uhrbacteria bacterium RIFCSPHIGHO2_01_FULL_46_23]OGL69867.1 MAG: hypothetical protein A3D60_00775 [Candidatus Uhrbacteria bacterium RIFCSPHIGHO2_02_FULL_47_29]OGL75652.1 MAG: hypothetical protein A3E96_01280 [Candidatus Uhrbacteria bacterium RIFCSPHIGHO2_12_FULL_46_13]OGL82464.1 MAG: hypothetical protein A2936_02045 [Candidatus Uhrbacteria bacterium RIFCSPLOWO2_01_FULL_47_25]OGL85242.1 MAG: hypothetical protein A3I37_02845 [Candidatus Uhrbact